MGVKSLAKSHKKFKEDYGKKYVDLFKELVEKGQAPKSLFIGCSDSRVVPNLITHTDPGEIFVTRNIGNFVPPYDAKRENSATAAVIEYALMHLQVSNIIICGHSYCGACEALFQEIPDNEDESNLKRWMAHGLAAKEQAQALVSQANEEMLLRATEKFNVIEQLNHLLTYPAVKHKVQSGELHVMGWFYHIENGNLDYFDPIEYKFTPLEYLELDKQQTDTHNDKKHT